MGNVLPGQYVIEVTSCVGNDGCAPSVGDFVQSIFTVTAGPSIRVYPVVCGATGTSGGCEAGAHVFVNGTGFLPTDTTCALGAPGGTGVILAGTQACVIEVSSGIVNASFTIGNVLPGQYVIMITAYPGGDSAQAIVNVVSGPSIRVYPVVCGATGTSGGCEAGAHVFVNGTGFLPTDTTCALGAPGGTGVILAGTQACVIEVSSGIVNASFTIGNVLPGQYVIMITAYPGGDSAQAIVNVVSGPSIRVYPVVCGATGTSGGCEAGAHVFVNGTGFLPTDTTCALGAPGGTGVILAGTQACVIEVSSGIVNASFTIGNVLPGQYVIMITAYPGGDSAQAIVNVVSGPSIRVYPVVCGATGTSGGCEAGAHVFVNGTGFLPTDTTCALGAPGGTGVILAGTQACAIEVGSGVVNASFTIGNVLPGQYVIMITAYPGGDSAQAIVNVVSGPSIRLYPATARTGAHILANGTGFLPTDTSCSVSGPIGPNGPSEVIVPGTAGCAIEVGSGVVNASFIISNVQPGQYVIEITACGGNNGCAPSAGDFAQAVLYVVSGPSIYLTPANVATGAHIFVNGTGFLASDTTCILVSGASNLVDPILAGTAACVIHEGTGVVNASFTVGNVPPGQYVIEVDASSAFITTITTTFTTGTSTTFTATATTSSTTTFTSTQNVQIDTAQALLNVVGGPSIRVYPVVCGATGTSGGCEAGDHIMVNGTGFLPTDTTCALGAPGGTGVIEAGTQACAIEVGSGVVNASFTIGNVLPGQYVIMITGYPGGDSAQAIVNVVSGPSIRVYPVACGATGTSGGCEAGDHVMVNGTGFLPTDTTCALGAPGGTRVIEAGTQACVIEVGTGVVNASFTIGSVTPGQYVIMITGYGGGDSAQAIVNVVSGPSIRVFPVVCGATGTSGGCETGAHIFVNGTGFLPTDQSCSLSSLSANVILPGTQGCVIEVGTGVVNASFTIGNVSPGQYVIEITGCLGNNGCTPSAGDFAQALVNVVSGPSIRVFPVACGATGTSGGCEAGAHIFVNGTGFLPTDTTCALGAPGGTAVIEAGTQACAIEVGSGIVNASFTINNVLPGQYVIMITGYPGGDSAQAIVNVVSGPSIRVFPVACGGIGTSGGCEAGAHIFVNGTGFLPTDTSCALGAPGGTGVIEAGTQACVIEVGTGVVNASFTIGNVLPGQYAIQITGYGAGDSAQAIVNVVSGPSIRVFPVACGGIGTSGGCEAGAHIFVNGTGFLPTDTSCALGAPGGTGVIEAGTQACVIEVGTGVVNASFTIGNVLPGQYAIQITGYGAGDSAQAIVNVVSGPSIRVYSVVCRSTGAGCAPGTHILVNGTGFLPTDTSCALGAPGGTGVIDPGTQACAIEVGTGIVNASFTIGNVTPGQYVIQITGYSGGDSAQAIVYVINGPRITLTPGVPATGIIGNEIVMNGTGFLPTDQSCSISGLGGGNIFNPVLTGSAGCVISVGTGVVNGSFIIGDVPPGQYVIEVTGCKGNNGCAPSVGDFAQQIVRVVGNSPELDLFPTNATNGATVVVRAYGLSASDTGCIILAFSGDVTPVHQDNTLITSPTCSIVSPQTAQGTFVVGPYATEDIDWNVTVKGTPTNDLLNVSQPFGVTASITVVPTSGTINTVFTYTGSGFESDAIFCNATVVPAFTGSTLKPSCALDPFGQVSGSVVVPSTAIAGTYAIEVVDSTGSRASAVFTVGTPSALVVLNPASVEQGQSVGVAGTGFNPQDAYCTINVPVAAIGVPTCLMSSGYASGSFTVAPGAAGGYYLITVQGCKVMPAANVCPPGDGLDFASNFLGVTLATTITTYSTTSSTSSTTTGFTFTTTSVATSFSYSSTTVQTTGILYTTYSHFVLTTVSGVTSTTYSVTSLTTQTQTTVTYSTTTQFTTVPCGPLPCGFSTQPAPFNPAPGIDSTGLLAALLLLIPMLLRRLFT